MQCLGPFTKNKEIIQKFYEIVDSRHICQNKLDKVCFQDVMADDDFKDLDKRTVSDKILGYKALHFVKTPKYDECQRDLLHCFTIFFIQSLMSYRNKS